MEERLGMRPLAVARRLFGRRSVMLIIRFRTSDMKRSVLIPVPIPVITVLVESFGFWGQVAARIWRGRAFSRVNIEEKTHGMVKGETLDAAISSVSHMVEGLWRELISMGSWTVVDIESSDGDRVSIRFY